MRRLIWYGTLVLAAGCGAPKPRLAPTGETLLGDARREFRRGHFQKALLAFQRVNFELPLGHADGPEVAYSLAECYFQTGDRVTAASEFRKVADQHPGSPYAPLALLRAGDSHLRLWRRAELDPTPGQTALALYQELAGRYPESDAAARAQIHVRRLREWFADKAYKNGLFYLRRKAYDSAMLYFKDVVANFPETPRAADALVRLVDTYRAIGYEEELQETCTHLRRFYPQAQGLGERCPAAAGTG